MHPGSLEGKTVSICAAAQGVGQARTPVCLAPGDSGRCCSAWLGRTPGQSMGRLATVNDIAPI